MQSLAASSLETWSGDGFGGNRGRDVSVSYYEKGPVVGWLLDAKIRRATDNKKSLDDVMRLAYSRYSGAKGYTGQEFLDTAQEVADGRSHVILQQEFVLDRRARLHRSARLVRSAIRRERRRQSLAVASSARCHGRAKRTLRILSRIVEGAGRRGGQDRAQAAASHEGGRNRQTECR